MNKLLNLFILSLTMAFSGVSASEYERGGLVAQRRRDEEDFRILHLQANQGWGAFVFQHHERQVRFNAEQEYRKYKPERIINNKKI
jgi:hypothetical protein